MPTALEALLDPVDPIEFREKYQGKQPLHIRGNPAKFKELFGWADLDRLLNAWPYPHPNVNVSRPGKFEKAATPASLVEQCRAGASLVVSKLELYDPRVGELARTLEAEIGEPLTFMLILSQPAGTAFVKHYDVTDVFVLHLEGHKSWSVSERTVEKPVLEMREEGEAFTTPPAQPTLECELAPGDVLYVPWGHWHQALAQSGPSMHLSVGVLAQTGIDFLTWLVGELRNDVRFRQELPPPLANETADAHEARVREYVTGLGNALLPRFHDDETIRSYLRHCVSSDRDVRRVKFPVQLFEAPGAKLGVRRFSRPARQRFVLDDGPGGGQITLSVWGHTLHLPKSAKTLLEFVLSRTAFAYEDAQAHAGGLTEEGIWEVLDPLLREGILDAADGAGQ